MYSSAHFGFVIVGRGRVDVGVSVLEGEFDSVRDFAGARLPGPCRFNG